MWLYINYPNPHFSIHRNPACPMIQMHRVPGQRLLRVIPANLGDFLLEFREDRIPFAAQSGLNDIWIEINLHTPEQELNLVHEVQALIGRRYRPLADARIEEHCP